MSTSYSITLASDLSVLELVREDGGQLQLRAGGHWVPVHDSDENVFGQDLVEVGQDAVSVFDALEHRRRQMFANQFRKFEI